MAVAAALAWSVFAFGAVYPWAAPPLLVLGLIAMVLARAVPGVRNPLDASATAIVLAIALQLVPLPPPLRAALSPDSTAYHGAMTLTFDSRAWMPLSLDPIRTRTLLLLSMAAFLLHAATRQIAAQDGRLLARWIAWIAMLAALVGFGGPTLFPDGRIYGFWTPIESGAAPFGAIINRNHFAAWAILAAVMTLGGLAAHVSRQRQHAPRGRALTTMLGDTRALWLIFAAALTVAAIVMTASRSAFAALVAAAAAAMGLMRRRAGARTMILMGAAGALCLVAAMSWARPDRLLSRLDAAPGELGVRQAIWQQSAAIARRYPVAGVGAGAFPSAMAFYQSGTRDVFFNHAHNQYLEFAAEGGLLLMLPLAVFGAALVRRVARGLREDRGSFFWLRAGAAAALAGLAIMCIWESPFRTPAVLMLAAVAAGLAGAGGRT